MRQDEILDYLKTEAEKTITDSDRARAVRNGQGAAAKAAKESCTVHHLYKYFDMSYGDAIHLYRHNKLAKAIQTMRFCLLMEIESSVAGV